jgi:hypothetical protein
MNPLQSRFAVVRRRIRLVASVRGVCRLVAVLLLLTTVACLLDWRLHLPALVRALALVGTLSAAAYVAARHLVLPLLARTDDLTLALRVEERQPELTDALASAVQFLERPNSPTDGESAELRDRAVRQVMTRLKGQDLSGAVDDRGVRGAGLALAATVALAAALALPAPESARIALHRLAEPFGGAEWPRQTQVAIEFRPRAPRGEPFEVGVQLAGIVPERAIVEYRLDGGPPLQEVYDVRTPDGAAAARFTARLEASRVQRDFRFRVRANDGDSGWHDVAVLPPPQLVALNGRPSPQAHLRYPAYTDLAEQDAPDGASSLDAVCGTHVTLRAAADRPLTRAWLEYPPELTPALSLAAGLGRLGAVQSVAAWRRVPARIDEEGRSFSLEFIARLSGSYVLYFEDAAGMVNTRLLDLAVLTDPPPIVTLERPSRTQDSLDVLPNAEVTLAAVAEDQYYAVRSLALEYRRRTARGSITTGRLPLFDQPLRETAPSVLAGLAKGQIPSPANPLRIRSQRVPVGRRWALRDLKLQEGDAVTLQAVADDFDDVTVGKQPGRSVEIELRVVGPLALDLSLNEAQGRIQQELLRLQKQQREALDKVAAAETSAKANQGKLRPAELDDVMQAEQQQQQIRARVGTPEEGLRAEVERVQRALRDNKLPRSGTHDRMGAVARELDRLARDHLGQVEPRLTTARKEQDAAPGKPAKPEAALQPLREARTHQEEINNTLGDLLRLLEPWSSTREIKGEAKSLLQEQRRLNEDTANLNADKGVPGGVRPEGLKPEQRGELERAAEAQQKLADRVGQLLSKMDRVAQERRDKDPQTADALRDAAKQGAQANAEGALRQAAQDIRQNQTGRAGGQQREGTQGLEKVVGSLEEQREADLDRLIKKLREAEQKLEDLTRRQEDLRKKAKEAAGVADPKEREEALRRLAREQEQLRQETQDMLRELTRLRADRASRALSQAAGRMGQAGRQMNDGGNSDEQQDEALDRLNEAKEEVQDARQDAEEELAREKLAKVADQIKGLRERQESRREESARLLREVLQQKGWRRPLLGSLRELSRSQGALAKETRALAEERLGSAKVFAHLMEKAAGAMEQAGDHAAERLDQAQQRLDASETGEPELDVAAEQTADEETQTHQREAVRRLDQLLESLKPDAGGGPRPGGGEGEEQPGGGGGGGGGGGSGDGIPPMAQLKVLRSLQVDVNARTERFHQQHPDVTKLTEKQRQALQALRQEQQDVADLFQQLTSAEEPAEEKKP